MPIGSATTTAVARSGYCTLHTVGVMDATKIDQKWGPFRKPDAPNGHWSWARIKEKAVETFQLKCKEEGVAIWAVGRVDVKLEGKCWYRLDFIEVHPQKRRGLLGALAVCLMAERAAELKCDGILLASVDYAVEFYAALEGVQRVVAGWNHQKGLVPFVFEKDQIGKLRERLNEFVEETEEE